MNKYVRAGVVVPLSIIKIGVTKIFHFKTFNANPICLISPFSEISMDRTAKLHIGKKFKMRDGAKIRVRKNAELYIGNNVSVSTNNIITCRTSIYIGDDVQFSPGVLVYDHDHDFRHPEGVKAETYQVSPIKIGNNVWIGANSIILRGTEIGDNSVIAAGSIVKGIVPENSIYVQKRDTFINCIQKQEK